MTSRGTSQRKGPEVGLCLICWRKSRGASMAGHSEQSKWKEIRQGDNGVACVRPHRLRSGLTLGLSLHLTA